MYFIAGVKNKSELLSIMGMSEDELPIEYLGVPLSVDYIHATHCAPLTNKALNRLQGWDSELLSTTSRAELIQTTITPTVLYWLLNYHLPGSILTELEKFCAYFYGRRQHKISWELLCRPKLQGGIGLRLFSDLR